MERGNRKLHFFDRFVGISLVYLLGVFRRKKTVKPHLVHVAFLEGNAIGDTVLLFGVVQDLKEQFPASHLVFFSGSTNYEIARINKQFNKVVKLQLKNPLESIRSIRMEGEFDVFVDFMSWPRISAILTAFAKARLKIGFKTQGQFRHYVYDEVVDHSNKIHELDNFRALMKPIGVTPRNLPSIETGDVGRVGKSAILHMYPSGFKSYLKKWPEENWKEIALFLLLEGYTVNLTGGPADLANAGRFSSHFKDFPKFQNYAGKFSLRETIGLLDQSDLLITVNTGIMHIAAALKTNLVVLHGPSSVIRWGARHKNAEAIQSPHKDAPCLNLGFEY